MSVPNLQQLAVGRRRGVECHCGAIIAALLALAVLAGCRTPMQDGPVPQSLATCRQYSQQGMSAIERGEWDKAESLLAKAIETCPVDAEARRHYAEALTRRGAWTEAAEQLDEAVRLSGDDASLWVRAAEVQLELGNGAAAQRRAERALELDFRQHRAWLVLGHIRRYDGAHHDAVAYYHRALSYAPDSADVLLSLAEIYRQLNEPQRALTSLHALVDARPAEEVSAETWFVLGQTYRALERYDDAIAALATARQRGAPFADCSLILAECQLAAGQSTAAHQTTLEALSRQPQHAQAQALLQRIELAGRPSQPMVQR